MLHISLAGSCIIRNWICDSCFSYVFHAFRKNPKIFYIPTCNYAHKVDCLYSLPLYFIFCFVDVVILSFIFIFFFLLSFLLRAIHHHLLVAHFRTFFYVRNVFCGKCTRIMRASLVWQIEWPTHHNSYLSRGFHVNFDIFCLHFI